MDEYQMMNDYQAKQSLFYQHAPTADAVFRFMNGKINTINKCTLNIQGYSTANYAHFQYPNFVTLFLGSIVDDVYERYGVSDFQKTHNWIMSLVCITLAHELYHADQDINNLSYAKDPDYANNVELAAEYNAEIFCAANKAKFKSQFSFDYMITKTSEFGTYNRNSLETFYINSIIGVFRNAYVGEQFTNLLHGDGNDAYLIIRYHNPRKHTLEIQVKENKQLVSDPKRVRKFSDNLMKIRHGTSATEYIMDIKGGHIDAKDADVLVITIVDQKYEPILFV